MPLSISYRDTGGPYLQATDHQVVPIDLITGRIVPQPVPAVTIPAASPVTDESASQVSQRQPAGTKISRRRTLDLAPLNTKTQPQLLTLEQAAACLNISTKKLRRLCREQKISHQRIDYRNYRFRLRDLEDFEKTKTFKRKGAFRD